MQIITLDTKKLLENFTQKPPKIRRNKEKNFKQRVCSFRYKMMVYSEGTERRGGLCRKLSYPHPHKNRIMSRIAIECNTQTKGASMQEVLNLIG